MRVLHKDRHLLLTGAFTVNKWLIKTPSHVYKQESGESSYDEHCLFSTERGCKLLITGMTWFNFYTRPLPGFVLKNDGSSAN